MPSQDVLARWSLSGHGQDAWLGASLSWAPIHPSASILEASQPFVIASFEMHAILISNILIAALISFKLHEKYKGLDQEIVTKF